MLVVVLVLVIMFGLGVVRVVLVFLLFVVVLFLIVVGYGFEEVHFGHCSSLVKTVAAFELYFTNPKLMLFFFYDRVKRAETTLILKFWLPEGRVPGFIYGILPKRVTGMAQLCQHPLPTVACNSGCNSVILADVI